MCVCVCVCVCVCACVSVCVRTCVMCHDVAVHTCVRARVPLQIERVVEPLATERTQIALVVAVTLDVAIEKSL